MLLRNLPSRVNRPGDRFERCKPFARCHAELVLRLFGVD